MKNNVNGGVNKSKLRLTAAVCALIMLMLSVLGACSATVKLIGISVEYTGEEIVVGGKLNKADIAVIANYSDGSSKTVTDFIVSGVDTTSVGDKTVTVTYTENNVKQTAQITVKVVARQSSAVLQSISAVFTGDNLYVGDSLDKSKVLVVANYSDGSAETVTDFTLGAVDTSSAGSITVTVTYTQGDITVYTTFSVTVIAQAVSKTLSSISAEYSGGNLHIGAALDMSAITVTANYSDGTSKRVNDFSIDNADTSTVGVKQILVSYTEQDITCTATFTVNVVSFSLVEITAEYNGGSVAMGGELDRTLLTVTAKYSNGLTEKVTDYQIEPYDTSALGSTTVTVKYVLHGITMTANFVIEVADVSLTGIAATYAEERIFVGEPINRDKVYVVATYSDGTSSRVTDFQLSDCNTSQQGMQTVTVSYTLRGVTQSATFNVYVSAPIELTQLIIEYTGASVTVGMRIDRNLLTVTACYSDNSRQTVTDYTLSQEVFDQIGMQTVTVTYTRANVTLSQTFNVDVVAPFNLVRIDAVYNGNGVTVGMQPNVNDLTITAYYSNGTSETVNPTQLSIDTSKVGYAVWNITYRWYNQERTTTVTVKVEPNLDKITAVYNGYVAVGAQPNRAQLTVTAYFSDDTSRVVTEFECGNVNTSVVGTVQWQITFVWFGQTASANAQLQVVAGLSSITAVYNGGNVNVGDQPDRSKLVVTAYFTDGSNKVVTDFDCDRPDTSSAGDVEWHISYTFNSQTAKTTVTITVTAQSGADKDVADMSIHFINLGQNSGDCIYIKAGDADILIDGGATKNSASVITQYVNQYCTDGIIEYAIITHADQDHIAAFVGPSGGKGLFDAYRFENLIKFSQTSKSTTVYEDFMKKYAAEMEEGANGYTAWECCNNINGAKPVYDIAPGITMTILYQKYYDEKSSDENNHSVCVLFTQGEHNYLFTGDLEKAGEESLVSSNPDLPQVDLFKAGHHGSSTSSNAILLNKIKPKYVCVSCAAGDQYKFPTQEFIDRIAQYTDKVYVTGVKTSGYVMNGNIVFTCIDGVIQVNCSNNNTLLKDSDWFRDNRTCPQAWK